MLLENIQEVDGIKYAFTAEGEFDTLYIAECREYNEFFTAKFYGKSNYSQKELMTLGNYIAQGWGAVCLKVKEA